MGRYKGKIHGWDVVNEAFTDDGQYRPTEWYNIAGKDFIAVFPVCHCTILVKDVGLFAYTTILHKKASKIGFPT